MSKPETRHFVEHEKWLQGDLSQEQSAKLVERVGKESLSRFRREDEALRADLMARLPADVFASRVRARAAGSHQSSVRGARLIASAAVAAAALMISVWQWPTEPVSKPAPGTDPIAATERVKGLEPQIRVYRKRASASERLQANDEARSGDLLQLGYVAAGRRHGVLLSVDGSGAVTLHVPESEAGTTELPSDSGEHLIGSAYELDAAPEFERFVLVLSNEPIPVALVVESVKRLGSEPSQARTKPLSLPVGLEQYSLAIRKAHP